MAEGKQKHAKEVSKKNGYTIYFLCIFIEQYAEPAYIAFSRMLNEFYISHLILKIYFSSIL